MIAMPPTLASKENLMHFRIDFEDAIACHFSHKGLDKCTTRYNKLVKKSKITKKDMNEYRRYCKKNGLRVTNMTAFFREEGMIE